MAKARRWATIWLVAATVATLLAATVRAQYEGEGLPAGVRSVTIDDQPINATTTPEVANRSPEFAGRVDPGPVEVVLAIVANGEIVTSFALPLDERSRFRGTAPDRFQPGTYALYLNDALIGEFVISEEEGGERGGGRGGEFDLARIAPLPIEFSNLPTAGLVLDGTRYFDLDQEAQRIAALSGDTSREAVERTAAELEAAGWLQRYEHLLAVPDPNDPQRFETEIRTYIYEYADAANAEAAFNVLAAQEGEEVADAAAFGDQSVVKRYSDIVPSTGAAYQAVRLVFRQDRVLVTMVYADLLNREPDIPTIQTVAQGMQGRAAAVLAGEGVLLSPKALRLDVGAAGQPEIAEAYQVIGGLLIPLYTEQEQRRAEREASYAGAQDVYTANFSARTGGRGQEEGEQPAESGGTLTYTVTILALPDEASADAWLAGLPERIDQDPLRGYLSFSPVADAPTYGAASATYTFRRRAGEDQTANGFRVYVRVGAEIAVVEYAAAGEVQLADVEGLVNEQVQCLERGACGGPAAIPGEERGGGRDGGGGQDGGGQDGGGQDGGGQEGEGEEQ
jgi:hypothetical protein